MKETTKAILTLLVLVFFGVLLVKILPSKNSIVSTEEKIESVRLYAEKKARQVVEDTKVSTKTLEERIEFLEKNDLTKEVVELQEQVQNLVTENGQLKIYIANLERMAENKAISDLGLATMLEAHFKEYVKYKTSVDIMLKSLGTEVGLLDKKIDELVTKERSVLTKETIIKNHYYCVPRRCCR